MRKNLIILLLICGSTGLFAQDFFHGVGVGYYNVLLQADTEEGTISEMLSVPGIMYKATLAWDAGGSNMFAVSSYPFLGFNFSSAGGSYLGMEIPILAEYYFGEPDDDRCFYINAGGTYGYAASYGDVSIIGPQFGLGGQLEVNDQLLGLRGSYTLGLNNSDGISRSTFLIGVYYCLDY